MKQKLFSLLTLLLVGISSAWADSFTATDISTTGTTKSNVTCTSTAGTSASANVCNDNTTSYGSGTASMISSAANSNPNSNYIEIKAASGYKLVSPIRVYGVIQNNSDANICVVYWEEDYSGSTFKAWENKLFPNRKTTVCDDAYVDISFEGTVRTIRLYKQLYINNDGFQSSSGTGKTQGGNQNLGVTQIAASATAIATTYSVNAVTSTGTDTYGTVSAAASSLAKDETTTITAVPASGYKVTNWAVSGTGASISPSGASNSLTTTLTMGTADATVTCTFGAASSYTVTHTLTNVTKTSGATSTYEYTDYTAVYAAEDGYVLPNTVTVTAGGSDITANCTWNKSTGTVTIPAAYVTGNIEITVIGSVYVAPTCGILFTLDFVNTSTVTMSDGDEDLALTSTYATITGGSATMSFFNSGKTDQTVINSSKKASYGTNNQYLKLTLTHALKPGDVISFAGGSGAQIAIANTGSKTSGTGGPANQSADDMVATTSYSYTVEENDAIDGLKVLYVGRATTSGTTHGKITIMRPATVSVGGKGYATYCNSESALDFTDCSIQPYVIASADGSTLTLTNKKKIAKNEPVLLYSTTNSDSKSVPAIADGDATADGTNKLVKGDNAAHTWAAGTAEHYVLATATVEPGFYRANNNTVASTKAYLDLTGLAPGAHSFTLDLGEGDATGISEIKKMRNGENETLYNLAGQRVNASHKGIVIVNGKKVVIK